MSNKLQISNESTRWSELTPYTIGLGEMLQRLDSYSQSDRYPKYNIIQESEKKSDDDVSETSKYVLEVALAGYDYSELEVSTQDNVLFVGTSTSFSDNRTYLYKGIAKRSINRTWQLKDNLKVTDVKFVNGLLLIYLEQNIPEHKKKTVWKINSVESETKSV